MLPPPWEPTWLLARPMEPHPNSQMPQMNKRRTTSISNLVLTFYALGTTHDLMWGWDALVHVLFCFRFKYK